MNTIKMRETADKMQTAIDDCFADRLTNTPKRLAQAEHKRVEGERLKRTQTVLRVLADQIDAGSLPATLVDLKLTKANIYGLMGARLEQVANGYHEYHVDTGEPSNNTPVTLALWAMIKSKTAEELQAEELKRKIEGLQFSKIPGYFPTPDAVIDRMIKLAEIEPWHIVGEPSAGHGTIADRVRPLCNRVDVCEYNTTLAEILRLKDYWVYQGDFLEIDTGGQWDRVLMNPPFENGQDIEHVRHAYRFLNHNGGRLVAVMSAGTLFRTDKRTKAFKEFLERTDGEVFELPDGAFKESGTGVKTCLVAISK